METPDKEKSPIRHSGLIILPFLILLGLLLAPRTRPFLQAQLHLLHDSGPFFPPLAEMGFKEGPPLSFPTWKQKRTPEDALRHPDDYLSQLGGALLGRPYLYGKEPTSRYERYTDFQHRYGAPLAAVGARFPERPGPYAHLLRLMTQSVIRVSREGEIETFEAKNTAPFIDLLLPNKTTGSRGETTVAPPSLGGKGARSSLSSDKTVGYTDSWAAFDQAAQQGEKRDPDNAYFPMMRAVGLFDAKRDAEGIAAVLRAGQKRRFDDYYREEGEATWSLSLHAYGPSSALVRQNIAYSYWLSHLSTLSAVGRLTVYLAEKAEQEGRTQDGLALRHAMMQCGLLMREQSGFLEARVGIGLFSVQTNLLGSEPLERYFDIRDTGPALNRHRSLYLAYLHKIDAEDEAHWFAEKDTDNRRISTLIETAFKADLREDSKRPLSSLWVLDMLLLTNLLLMLLFCTAAIFCKRLPRGEKALPVVIGVLFMGGLLAALTMQWAEALGAIRWMVGTLNTESYRISDTLGISGVLVNYPSITHLGEVFFSLSIPTLMLLVIGIRSMARRETFAVALPRGLRQGSLFVTLLLTIAYAGALIATAGAESRTTVLDGAMPNGVADLRRYLESNPGSDQVRHSAQEAGR